MQNEMIYKEMYYRLFGKVCDVIEHINNIDEAKALLIKATQETEKMFEEYEE